MTAPPPPPRGGHLAGLDGLRAVAVLVVLGYHSGWSWLRGGFLGVSLFFTLSGFLITRLLVLEHLGAGYIDLRRFWARRARRLLPAAFAAILLGAGVAAAVGTPSQRISLPGDAIAALLYGTNWRFVLAGTSYAGIYEAPSVLQHLWSLAVEEQLYLLVPVLVAGLLAAGRGAARAAVAALVAATALATALLAPDAALETLYYGTHVRATELLVGVLLALLVAAPDRPAPRAVVAIAGPAALGFLAWTWTTWRFADAGLYRGGLAVHAVAVAVVLWSVAGGAGPLSRGLEHPALTWIGRRSYGIYVYHWPLFLLARQADVAVAEGLLLAAAWLGSGLLAAVSYVRLEQPVRTGRAVRGRRTAAVGLVAGPAVCVLVAFGASAGQDPVHDPDAAAARLEALAAGADGPSAGLPERAPDVAPAAGPAPAGPPVRLAIFGDSIAAADTLGLAEWAVADPRFDLVPGLTIPGCTLVPEGTRWSGESPIEISDGCDWERYWPALVAEHRPDVAVVAIGGLDALPWSLPGEPGRLRVGDAAVDMRLRREIDGINDAMHAAGVHTVWLTLPDAALDNGTSRTLAAINRMIARAAAGRGDVHVFDMARIVNRWNDEGLHRSDGVHLEPEDSRRLAQEELAPWLVGRLGDLRS